RGGGDVHLRQALVIGLLRRIVVLAELGSAGELRLGKLKLSLGLRLLGLRRLERTLEQTRLDDEQKVALLDQLAVREIDGLEITADPRAHLARLARLHLAGAIGPLPNLSHDQ